MAKSFEVLKELKDIKHIRKNKIKILRKVCVRETCIYKG